MIKYILKRLAASAMVLLAVSFLTYFVLNLAPGDTPTTVLTHTFLGFDDVVKESDVKAVSQMHGLDKPLIMQYVKWLGGAVRGNLGMSYSYNVPVSTMLVKKLPYSLILGIMSFLLALLIAIPIGIFTARKRNNWIDHLVRLLSIISGSVPGFWIGLMLIVFFSVKLNLLPVSGMNDGIKSIVLPCITLMIGMIPTVLRVMRSSMIEVIGQDYMILAKAKGLEERASIRRHGIRNALPPVITIAGLELGHILGGSVVIETIFVWPGIGNLLKASIDAKDIPMLQGCVLMIALCYIVCLYFVDIIYAALNPQARKTG